MSSIVERLRYIAGTDDARYGEISGTLKEAAALIEEMEKDVARLDWAETHPELAMRALVSWWATAGPGCREIRFEFRNILDAAIKDAPFPNEQWPRASKLHVLTVSG